MSMLLGVRGSSRDSEGQPVRESIIQQPGRFYSGQQTSSIWSSPPTPPTWRDSSSANALFPSSTATSESSVLSSLSSSRSSGMEQHQQWQQRFVFQAGGDGARIDEQKDTDASTTEIPTQHRSDAARSSTFVFGFPSRSASSVNSQVLHASCPFQPTTPSSGQDHVPCAGGSNEKLFGESGTYTSESQGSQMPSSDAEVEELSRNWEARLRLQAGHTSLPRTPAASPYAFTANEIRQSAGKSASNLGAAVNLASGSAAGKVASNPVAGTNPAFLSATQSIPESIDKAIIDPPYISSNDAKSSSSQSDSQKIFVFGACGASGTNARAGVSQQKISNFPAAGSCSKRMAKIRKQNSSLKGQAPAVVGGVGFSQHTFDHSREGSPLPSPRVDPGDNSTSDDAECSHILGHGTGDVDTSEYGSSKLREAEGHSYWAETNSVFGFDPEHSQKMEEQFGSWDPFLPDCDEASMKASDQACVEDCVGLESDETIAKLMTEMKQFGSPLGKGEKSGSVADGDFGQEGRVKVFPGGEAVLNRFKASRVPLDSQISKDKSVEELRCRIEMLGRSGIPVDRQDEDWESIEELRHRIEKLGSSDMPMDEQKVYQECIEELRSRIEKLGKNDMPRGGQKENKEFVSDGGSKDGAYPFVFRASKPPKSSSSLLQTASENESNVFNESGARLPSMSARKGSVDLDNNSRSKEFPGVEGINCGEPIQSSRFTWSAASSTPPYASGVQFDSAMRKDSPNAHLDQFLSSSNSFVRAPYSGNEMQESSFMKSHSEGPVGEFAGPPSSSESSLSDSSPARSEDWSAADGLAFGSTQFQFQGHSERVHSGLSTAKKKARVSSAIRKQSRRPSHRQKKSSGFQGGLLTTPVKEGTGSPMDFSPSTGDTAPSFSTGGFKEAYREEPFDWATAKDNSKEGWASSAELNVENLRAAAARLNIEKELRIDSDIGAGYDSSFQRSAKSKRSSLEEVVNASSENLWTTSQTDRIDDDDERDNVIGTANKSGSGAFIFGGNPQSSSAASRHAWRVQRESHTEIGRYPIAHSGISSVLNTTGSIAPGTAGLGRRAEEKVLLSSQGLSHEKQAAVKANDLGLSSSAHYDSGMPASPNTVKSAAAEQVCERWRLRGNKAYANGDFPKAEEYYSRGASSVSPNETSQSCIRASMLCYSNRAATRMAVGRMREALADCMRAMVVDPNFVRVRLRAASCYLALGESEAAGTMFRECLKQAKEGNKPDPKIAADAVDGIKKTQQLDDYTERASELLQKENSSDYTAVLRLLNEALLISPYSELLLEMKSQIFFSLRRFEEVVQLCEQSLVSAERNHGFIVAEQQPQDCVVGEPSSGNENIVLKLWRWRMSAKSLFHLGKLEESLDLLTKHEEALSAMAPNKAVSIESLAPLVSCITDLLRHKAAGNEAFQAGKHVEAVEHYTAALACNGESRPYNAVCFCNRAAASQSLGHIADAIADCSRAIALDANYPKAISRRATLHEMVRDFGQACNDLQRLVTLLEGYQSNWKNSPSSRTGSQNGNAQDLRQARDRLAKAEDEMKKGYPINHYLILGIESSCSANEIKKAYRKAALKHHPDKAGQFLVRNDNGDDGALWKEVGDEVRRDAERLFKMIGEAYAILSDPTKRLRYDTEEEHRKLRAKGSVSVSATSDGYRSQYEKSSRRQHDRYTWNGYAPQYQRWQSAPDAAQPDTYARKSTYAANGSRTSGNTSRHSDYSFDDI